MEAAERLPLIESELGVRSKELAARLFRAWPALREVAEMEAGGEPEGRSLVIDLPSPTGDEKRRLGVWLDEEGVPSVSFGAWHTHGDLLPGRDSPGRDSPGRDSPGRDSPGRDSPGRDSPGRDSPIEQAEAIVDLVDAIFRDQLVLICDLGGGSPGHTSALDLRAPNALAEELTDPHSPGAVLVKSWTGAADRRRDLDSIEIE